MNTMPEENSRLPLLLQLGAYMRSDAPEWSEVKERAHLANAWFTPPQIETAVQQIATWLDEAPLRAWLSRYTLHHVPKIIGIVMAGNIPLVGFHDWLCGFVCGHQMRIKLSGKDDVLLKHLLQKIQNWDATAGAQTEIAEQLKNCDAYIATGSNNSSRYFEAYFGKYPNIIRRNRTSVAVLDGQEALADLQALAADMFTYYGLGCRNVTQICVPEGYDFTKLLDVCNDYEDCMLHHKYKNNYDYHLALYLLNKVPYLTNGSLLLVENALPFSAVSVLHYRTYTNREALLSELRGSADIQAIVGDGLIPFGHAQKPSLTDYADGVDTMQFLCSLS